MWPLWPIWMIDYVGHRMKHDGMSNFPLLSKCFCPFLQFKYQGMLSSQQIYVGIPSIVLNSLLKFCRFTKSPLVFITPTFAKWILDIKPPPGRDLPANEFLSRDSRRLSHFPSREKNQGLIWDLRPCNWQAESALLSQLLPAKDNNFANVTI